MRKSKDISKYCVDWQITRVSLKKLKTYQEKCAAACAYYDNHRNIADRERVMNYLEGLALGYPNEVTRLYIRNTMNDVGLLEYNSHNNSISSDLGIYNSQQLDGLAKDLHKRATNWLSRGYRNTELLEFITMLYIHTNNSAGIKKLNNEIVDSKCIPNTYNFFF